MHVEHIDQLVLRWLLCACRTYRSVGVEVVIVCVTVFAINMNCLKCNSYLFISLTAIMLCNCTLQLIQCLLYI